MLIEIAAGWGIVFFAEFQFLFFRDSEQVCEFSATFWKLRYSGPIYSKNLVIVLIIYKVLFLTKNNNFMIQLLSNARVSSLNGNCKYYSKGYFILQIATFDQLEPFVSSCFCIQIHEDRKSVTKK